MKLPILKHLKVEHLSLYKRPIDIKILPGINLIIGGNGIGKTTLINTIVFALVGNESYERQRPDAKTSMLPLVRDDYFQGRIAPEDQDLAQVTLTFNIEKREITITRALYRPRILKLSIKESGSVRQIDEKPDALEQTYKHIMQQTLEINKFEDFVFLLANLLLFDEERRTLAWDSEIQNRVIRLLFVSQKFDKEFSKYSKLFNEHDTTGRHKSEDRKNIRRAIDEWHIHKERAQKDTLFDGTTDGAEKQKIEFRVAELQTELDSVIEHIERLKETLEKEISNLKMLNADTDKLELKRAPLASQLADLENTFYSSVYKNLPAQYVIILETLIKQGTCQLCGTHAAHLRTLGHNLKRENKCVVCRSPVNNDYSDKGLDKQHLTKQINELRDQLDALDATQAQYLKVQGTAKREIDNLHVAISDKHKQQRRMETEIAELRTKYIIAGGTSSSTEGDQDVWVEEQEKRIQKLTSEIETLYRKRDEVTVKLKELNQEVLTVLRNVNQRLTLLFSRFASQFLGTPCELVVSHKTKAKKPNAYMYPRFHERERENINQVSESQRFFIDQAFRMALITWYTEETGQPTLCIVETPEGSLDLAYEQNVAKMYTEFASYGHSIIARLCCTNIEPLL